MKGVIIYGQSKRLDHIPFYKDSTNRLNSIVCGRGGVSGESVAAGLAPGVSPDLPAVLGDLGPAARGEATAAVMS